MLGTEAPWWPHPVLRGQLADEQQGALEHKLVGCRQPQEILQGVVAVNSLEKSGGFKKPS